MSTPSSSRHERIRNPATRPARGPYEAIGRRETAETTKEEEMRKTAPGRPPTTSSETPPPPAPEAGVRHETPPRARIHRVDEHAPAHRTEVHPDPGMVHERTIGGSRAGIPGRQVPQRRTKAGAPTALTTKRRNTLPMLNFLLVAGLGLALILGVAGVAGPGVVPTSAALMSLTISILVVATVTFVLMNSLRPSNPLRTRMQDQERRLDTLERNVVAVAEARRRDIEAALIAHGEPVRRQHHAEPKESHVTLVEGIGPVYADRLARAGIRTVDDLMRAPTDRIADAAAVHEIRADEWQSMARLLQVPAIGPQYAETLVHAGIRTREQLANQDPAMLAARIRRMDQARRMYGRRTDVGPETVHGWIEAARRSARSQTTTA